MRTPIRPAWLLLTGIAAAGCSSVRVTTQVDPAATFAAYRTFDWVSPEDVSEDPAFPGLRHDGREVIARELTAKGYRRADGAAAPDLLVQFYAFVERDPEPIVVGEDEVHQTGTPDPQLPPERTRNPSAPRPDDPSIRSSAEDVAVEELEVDELEEGDLVLEMLDGRTRQVVWRGIGKGIADPEAPKAELEQALTRVLAEFPSVAGR